MTPDEGKIYIVDDSEVFGAAIETVARDAGFETLRTTSKEEALATIERFGKLGIVGVLIDGNLTKSSQRGSDGIEVNAAIKAAYGDTVRTAGISAQYPITGANIEIVDLDLMAIREALQNL